MKASNSDRVRLYTALSGSEQKRDTASDSDESTSKCVTPVKICWKDRFR